ncbi:MAG: glycine cleavage system aminomethyltransferase GcvT, partial [Actinobacteria bacterium]|nr:glycine cleavage system aminomethyltransferase GcvT [Actinomycetota bacterium]
MQSEKEYKKLNKTPLYSRHLEMGAKTIEFAGWLMPLNYSHGIMHEHLATRKSAGLFDISHMGRFKISGKDSLSFLQHVLTNNAASLEVGESHYTIISDNEGTAIDDLYLYRFYSDSYILVANASNYKKDKNYMLDTAGRFGHVSIEDITESLSMLSIQGPKSREILLSIISSGSLPEPLKNKLGIIYIDSSEVLVARTGYTGEPLGFELFIESKKVETLWNKLISKGASPVGLAARDTLRLEASLPLYGHELGINNNNIKIPVFSSPQSRLAVSFSELKNNFIGKDALMVQFNALKKILNRDYSQINSLPRIIMPLELLEKGIARAGDKVYFNGNLVGSVTSGTIVPYWIFADIDSIKEITEMNTTRSIALALIDSRMWEQDIVEIDIRGRKTKAVVMPYFLRSEAPPYAYPITSADILKTEAQKSHCKDSFKQMEVLIEKSHENSTWRQKECINLIPSEMTPSRIVKLL